MQGGFASFTAAARQVESSRRWSDSADYSHETCSALDPNISRYHSNEETDALPDNPFSATAGKQTNPEAIESLLPPFLTSVSYPRHSNGSSLMELDT
jgi:hypothetical protein